MCVWQWRVQGIAMVFPLFKITRAPNLFTIRVGDISPRVIHSVLH